jgi:hypothetical protein
MVQSIFIYITLMMTMVLFGTLAAKRTSGYKAQNITFIRFEVLFPIFFFAVVLGMRYNVGDDYLAYLNTFRTGEGIDRYEWAFRWFTILLRRQDIHFAIYFSIIALIQVFFFFYAFRDERYLYPYFSFLLFTGGYFLGWMNGMRQDIAACIFIFAIRYLDQKKLFKYTIWCLIAFLFHKTAILLILLYPVLKGGKDYFRNIFLQISLYVIALSVYYSGYNIENLFSSQIAAFTSWFKYDSYTLEAINTMTLKAYTGIGFLLLATIDVLIILYSQKIKNFYNSKLFVIIYNIYFFGTLMRITFAESIILQRPFRYFRYFSLVVVAYFLYYLQKNSGFSLNKLIMIFVFIIYILLFIALIFRGETNMSLFSFFWQV